MNELSLFTGAGGGVLGSKLLGHRMIGYVENNEHCQKIIASRISDGIIPGAPIFSDIRLFNRDGYAEAYQGLVDIVSGGFPCQDISCAGKGAGITGARSGLWSEMATTIRTIQPRCVFIENSPMLTKWLGSILGDLAALGYNAIWGVLGGFASGCCINGERMWVFASKANSIGFPQIKIEVNQPSAVESSKRQFERAISAMLPEEAYSRISRNPAVMASWVDRLRAIGNGQVPIVAATAFRILSGILGS